MQYDLGKLNGRHVVYWWGDDGKRVRFRLDAVSKGEAKAEALRIWENHHRMNGEKVTLADLKVFYENYLGSRRTGKQLRQFWKTIGPSLGMYLPEEINDDIISKYTAKRQEMAIKRRGKKLSNGTLFAEVNMVQNILNYGMKKNLIKSRIVLDKPVRPAPKDRWLTRPEIDRLLEKVRDTPHLYTATLLMLATAGRVGAVLELTWKQVNFDKNAIDLRVDPELPAKGRARVPMNDGLRAHLLDLCEQEPEWQPEDPVVSFRGLGVASIFKAFKRHCRDAGLPDVSPHVMRKRRFSPIEFAAFTCSGAGRVSF